MANRYTRGTVNTDQYEDYEAKSEAVQVSYQSYGEDAQITTVDANNIHGVDTFGVDVQSDEFWNHHGNTHEDYSELASHIPEVQERLDNGEELSSIQRDPEIGATATQYFDESHMPRVAQYGDTYIAQDDGRHRILAAQEQGHDIPVKVVGEFQDNSQSIDAGQSQDEGIGC